MRILLVFSSSEIGGAERSLTRMVLAARADVQFDMATLDGNGPWVRWCREMGAEPVVLGKREEGARHGCFGWAALWRLAALVRQKRYTALYVIGLRASLWVRLLKPWLAGARLVHGIRWNPDAPSRLDRAFRLVERFLGGPIDLYICNSDAAALTLVRRVGVPGSKIRVIRNGLARLPTPPRDVAERPPNAVVVANLSPRKGHAEFLDVVAAVCDRLPKAHFFLVGRDEMHGQLANEIARRGLTQTVTLTGYQDDVGSWLDRARAMVLPSLWGEGCPTSILEGFAHGLPVVAYAIDGVPELIADGIDGFLVPPRDTKELAEAIMRVFENPEMAARMGESGRSKVEQNFTLVRCASQHVAIFSKLVADVRER